jgi:hypothetical protein
MQRQVDVSAELLNKTKDSLWYLEKTKDISEKIIALLETVDNKRDKYFYDKAEEIFNSHYFKLQHVRLKRALSQTEIKKIFDDDSLLKKTIYVYKQAHSGLEKGIKCVSRTVEYCEAFYSLKVMFGTSPKSLSKNQLIRAQDELFNDYKKMQALTGILKSVASHAPPIIRDYMTFALDVFIMAEGPVKMVMKYAQKIMKESGAIDSYRKNTSGYESRVREVMNWREK